MMRPVPATCLRVTRWRHECAGARLATAREDADVVLVAMHWGRNGKSTDGGYP